MDAMNAKIAIAYGKMKKVVVVKIIIKVMDCKI
jgi:hypothetical protein